MAYTSTGNVVGVTIPNGSYNFQITVSSKQLEQPLPGEARVAAET